MSNKVMYMTFYENWIEVMEMCTPEEWYELCKIITNLRFKGIDTDAKTISNLKIKMAWNLIRPSILKSNRNTRYNNKDKENTQPQQEVKTEVAVTGYTSPSEAIKKENDMQMPNEDLKPTEAVKSTINDIMPNEFMDGLNDNTTEEENLKDMGTFIGDFKELNSKTTTPNVEEEFDNFSDELNDLLDANEAKTEQIAQAKYLRKYLGIKNDAAYELSIKYYNQLKEQLTTEKDIEDLNKYLREKAEMKHNR